jgi:hypothetical protein
MRFCRCVRLTSGFFSATANAFDSSFDASFWVSVEKLFRKRAWSSGRVSLDAPMKRAGAPPARERWAIVRKEVRAKDIVFE